MPYGKLLFREIQRKEMSIADLAKALNKDRSYISKIINGSNKPPTDKVNEQIASVLECDARRLNMEAYYDKAPNEIREIIKIIIQSIFAGMLKMLEKNCGKLLQFNTDETVQEIMEEMKKEPICDVLIQIIDNKASIISATGEVGEMLKVEELDKEGLKAILTFKEPIGTNITDNGMMPKISKGSRVKVEIKEKYSNGDIVCLKGENGVIARELQIEKGYYKFMPYNLNEYSPKIYAQEDGEKLILSKVVEVTTKL